MMEEWRDIEGYEGLYQVSNLGKVKSLDRVDCRGRKLKGKIMKQKLTKNASSSSQISNNSLSSLLTYSQLIFITPYNPHNFIIITMIANIGIHI